MADRTTLDVAKALEALGAELGHVSDAALEEVAHAATSIIALRTAQGKDVSLKPFAPYSESYRQFLTGKQRRDKRSKSPELVNLVYKGHMLGAMIPGRQGQEAVVHFNSALEATKAAAHNEGVNKSVVVKTRTRTDTRKVGKKRVKVESTRLKASRDMNLPQRRFFGIEAQPEVDILGGIISQDLQARASNAFKK